MALPKRSAPPTRLAAALATILAVASGCGRLGYDAVGADAGAATDGATRPDATSLDASTRLTLAAEAVLGARSMDVLVTPSAQCEVAILVTDAAIDASVGADVWTLASATGAVIPGSGGATGRHRFPGLAPETDYFVYAIARRFDGELSNVVELAAQRTRPLFGSVTFPGSTGDSTYVFYKPERYYRDPGVALPLLIFLHGWGARGSLPEELPMNDGMFREIAMDVAAFRDFPFFVIAPICDEAIHAGCFGWTDPTVAREALDDALTRTPIDTRRVYVTGLSTGGQGALELAVAYPDRVAAAVPIASTYSAGLAGRLCRMSGVPTWMFHSSLDRLQSPSNSQMYFDALAACAPTVAPQLDLHPWTGGANDHAGWIEVYGDDHPFSNMGHASIYDWMLSFSLP